MLFNISSVIGFLVALTTMVCLIKSNKGLSVIKWLSVLLIVFKTLEYIYMNLFVEIAFPIEISTVTYFMFSIIVLFNMKKFFHIASFFALISGIGFFLYYSLFGYISSEYFGIGRHIVAIFSHGILLIGGGYIFVKNNFKESNKLHLVIVMLAIIAHASIFYIDTIKGATFVYFLVKPEFLNVFSNYLLNHLFKATYYIVIFFFYSKIIHAFYNWNYNLITKKKTINNDNKYFLKNKKRTIKI
ncbi:MAG: hypothetical protein KAH13_00940 [Tenericutes bacterium]|nr:hypothetical protein [Mycoplasmatota bacterium]